MVAKTLLPDRKGEIGRRQSKGQRPGSGRRPRSTTDLGPPGREKGERYLASHQYIVYTLGRVRNLLVDTEGGLLKLARKAMTKVSGELLRHQGTPIEVVSAHGHWPRGLVEARAKVIGTALGRLDKSKETISATELQYQLELVVSHLNDTPYALKRQSKLPGIHQLEQDVLLDTICPNTWRIGGRSDWNAPARMELVTDVEIQVQKSLIQWKNSIGKPYFQCWYKKQT